jgi:hypothetical protein
MILLGFGGGVVAGRVERLLIRLRDGIQMKVRRGPDGIEATIDIGDPLAAAGAVGDSQQSVGPYPAESVQRPAGLCACVEATNRPYGVIAGRTYDRSWIRDCGQGRPDIDVAQCPKTPASSLGDWFSHPGGLSNQAG